MRVIITGAAGVIGRLMTDELSPSHELRLLDRLPIRDRRSQAVDLGQPLRRVGWRRLWPRSGRHHWMEVLDGADVVLHLAAQPSPHTSWEKVLHDNVQTTWNVVYAAASRGVRCIVFASSIWAVRALERALAPACYLPDGPKIGSDAPARPLTPYGLSKAIGEQMGRQLVDEASVPSFLAVRIGHHQPAPPRDEELRRLWVGTHDLRGLLRRCVEAQVDGFHVVYGMSTQTTSPYDLTYTRTLLSWSPEQRP
jgi:uronate dehydrogenase